MLNYIIERLKERSTWLGIISIVTAAGVSLSPEQSEAIVSVGVVICGAIAAFTADAKAQ